MAIIYGTDGDDKGAKSLLGTASADVMYGLNGHDVLSGTAGNDRLYGNAGNDLLSGGDHDDVLIGGAGADELFGGAGIDTASYHLAGSGVTISLATWFSNGQGSGGEAEGDMLASTIENLTGSSYADTLIGNDGANVLTGGGGNDVLIGGAGSDQLLGGSGNDILTGGRGDPGFGPFPLLNGGAGSDTASYAHTTDGMDIELDKGFGQYYVARPGELTLMLRHEYVSIENIIGGAGEDWMTGNDADNRFEGAAGDDELFGAGGNDQLFGGKGNDRLIGGAGADQLHGGSGIDSVSYYDGATGVVIDLQTGMAAGDAAGDQFSGIENVSGSAYAGDMLSGNSSANILDGRQGHDWLDGRGGNDTLTGGSGNDRFIYKMAATDDFVSVNIGGGLDVISDFKQGEDKLDISVDRSIPDPNELHVSGQDVFEVLDSNNDNKLTGADYRVDQTTLVMNGKASTALVLDIGAGVGEQLFGGAGEDTLALLGVTVLAKSDFALA